MVYLSQKSESYRPYNFKGNLAIIIDLNGTPTVFPYLSLINKITNFMKIPTLWKYQHLWNILPNYFISFKLIK